MAKRKVRTNISPFRLGTPAPLFRYHGTRRACLIGNEDPGHGRYLQTCPNAECSICQILRNSFQLGFSSEYKTDADSILGTLTDTDVPLDPNAMFGRGISSSTCSSSKHPIFVDYALVAISII
jgi:hypothetical protein